MCHEAGQSAVLHAQLYLSTNLDHILFSNVLGTNSLSALMCCKAVNQSINHLLDSIYRAADNGLTVTTLHSDHTILLIHLTSSFSIINFSHNWLKSQLSNRSFSVTSGSSSSFILPSSCGFSQGSVLGPILFTICVSPIASIVSSHGVNKQQYADDTLIFVFLSPSPLSSSLCSLQRCVSSLHSWFIHNGLFLNPTKTEAVWFVTGPRLQSLSNLNSIEVAGISVSLIDLVSLLTNFSTLISTFPTFALHPTFISVLSAIFARFVTQKLPRPSLWCCRFQIWLCQFHFDQHFFSQYPSSSARSTLNRYYYLLGGG